MTALPANLRNVWRHLSRIDLFAIGLILGGATCAFLDLSGGLASFLKFFAIIATVYAAVSPRWLVANAAALEPAQPADRCVSFHRRRSQFF